MPRKQAVWVETTCAFCGVRLKRKDWKLRECKRSFCDQTCLHRFLGRENALRRKREAELSGNPIIHGKRRPCYESMCAQCGVKIMRPIVHKDRTARHFCGTVCMYQWRRDNKDIWAQITLKRQYVSPFNDPARLQRIAMLYREDG